MLTTLAWRNIWRNKRRSFITMSSIGFAVIFATMMTSVQRGSWEAIINNSVKFSTGHYQIQHPEYWGDRTLDNSIEYSEELVRNLDGLTGIQVVSPRIESFALASTGENSRAVMVMGVDPTREEGIIGFSRKLEEGEIIESSSKGIMIAQGLAEYLQLELHDSLILLGQGYHGTNAAGLFRIEGILKYTHPVQNKQMVCMSLANAQWFYGMDNRLTSTVILLDDNSLMTSVGQSATPLLSEDTDLVEWATMIPDLIQTAEMKYASSTVMSLVLFAVIGFGMFGTFLMMTAERNREFGIMMAVGMSRTQLQITTFLEILFLAALGVLVGLAISAAVIIYFNQNPVDLGSSYQELADSYGMEMSLIFSAQGRVFFTQAFAVFMIAFILSVYPMLAIQKVKEVDAIREG